MTKKATYTTLAAWPLAICQALEARGIPPGPLLAAAQLNREEFVSHPEGRLDVRLMTRFWEVVLEATGDEAFGLSVAQYVQPMNFRALGLLMHTAGNLEQAFLKLGQYSALVSNSASIRIEQTPQNLVFCIDPIPGVTISTMAIDSFLATLTRFADQLGAARPFVDKVEFLQPSPRRPEAWSRFFGAPVAFGAAQNAVWLNRLQLKRAEVMGDLQMSAYSESLVQSYVGGLGDVPLTHQVKQLLNAQLEKSEPNISVIAQRLNLTERSLRRRLKDENTTYRDLVQQCRMELAEHYLTHTSLSITDIALRVGFTDTGNFSRAFTRHFGKTPSGFRNKTSPH
ncbi:AraC family transcriptional regulator [Marinobacter sp. 1-3A]|uniref:AraC family transcriptional regulator n=1 Tax=Marinobacter sp. 1-3A TaxID=2582920 RepID=UPI00190343A7|nr:AraC family transcriptional regulator [Marinobacter sp. 1-3A]MBK1873588.1 AraC family transcriptional regulator [Marinobacter sp. 1-3A]